MAKDTARSEAAADRADASAAAAQVAETNAETSAAHAAADADKAAAVPEPVKKTDEELRRESQDKARQAGRQRAADAFGKYKVTLDDKSGVFEARDANEAWAMFCDANKQWPSPKYSKRQIEKVAA